MLLSQVDGEQFFKLHRALMFFVNQRLKVTSEDVSTPDEFSSLAPETRIEVRNAFLDRIDLLEAFVQENPADLRSDELDMVRSWKHFEHGNFYIFRQLRKHMLFLSSTEPPVAYGVLALSQPFDVVVGPYLPILVETVLLPFKDVIVYDSLISFYHISFGGGIKRMLNESYKKVKAARGIVTSLPKSNERQPGKVKAVRKSRSKEPSPFLGRWRIISMPEFGDEYLDEEVEAFVKVSDRNSGDFHFGNVQGHMDCRLTTRDGEPAIEWSWDGNSEMDAAQGRGWAVLKGNELHGIFFFHGGDESAFVAAPQRPPAKKRQR